MVQVSSHPRSWCIIIVLCCWVKRFVALRLCECSKEWNFLIYLFLRNVTDVQWNWKAASGVSAERGWCSTWTTVPSYPMCPVPYHGNMSSPNRPSTSLRTLNTSKASTNLILNPQSFNRWDFSLAYCLFWWCNTFRGQPAFGWFWTEQKRAGASSTQRICSATSLLVLELTVWDPDTSLWCNKMPKKLLTYLNAQRKQKHDK